MHFLLLTFWLTFHPVHVSITSIDLVPGTDSLKVYVKLYYDDFLKDYAGLENKIQVTDSNVLTEEHLVCYLGEKVKIRMDNKELKGKLMNMVLDNNELSLNLLYKPVRNPVSIAVRSTINASLYADQANMIILRINDLEEGFKLTPENTEQTFKLKVTKNTGSVRK